MAGASARCRPLMWLAAPVGSPSSVIGQPAMRAMTARRGPQVLLPTQYAPVKLHAGKQANAVGECSLRIQSSKGSTHDAFCR